MTEVTFFSNNFKTLLQKTNLLRLIYEKCIIFTENGRRGCSCVIHNATQLQKLPSSIYVMNDTYHLMIKCYFKCVLFLFI